MSEPELPHLAQIAATIQRHLPKASLYLTGSAARGEAVFRTVAGRPVFFSDYEFISVSSRPPAAGTRTAIRRDLNAIEALQANPNPLFHIDLAHFQAWRLSRLPRNIFTFELKANARLLHGRDVRSRFPAVTPRGSDLRLVNEIVLKRLWALCVLLPNTFITGSPGGTAEQARSYVLARNALDLATVLLPHAGILMPGYAARDDVLQARWAQLPFAGTFGNAFPVFMHACLESRRSLALTAPPAEIYAVLLGYIERLLAWLAGSAEITPAGLRNVFPERPYSPRQWVNQAVITRSVLKNAARSEKTAWLRKPKKAEMTIGLLDLSKAHLAWVQGKAGDARAFLEQSADRLEALQLTPFRMEGEFQEDFDHLREAWAGFWNRYLRFGDTGSHQKDLHALHFRYD